MERARLVLSVPVLAHILEQLEDRDAHAPWPLVSLKYNLNSNQNRVKVLSTFFLPRDSFRRAVKTSKLGVRRVVRTSEHCHRLIATARDPRGTSIGDGGVPTVFG